MGEKNSRASARIPRGTLVESDGLKSKLERLQVGFGWLMTTPDGISTEDWDMVHELAVDLVNASDDDASARCRRRLLDCLNDLEIKYGPLPTLIATRADYIDDDSKKEALLHQAHALAELRGDQQNMLYIAHSLAEMYIEKKNLVDAGKWLGRLKESLSTVDDPFFTAEYLSLSVDLDDLIRRMTERRGRI